MVRKSIACLFGNLVDLLYPPRCVFCGAALLPGDQNHGVCDECLDKLPFLDSPLCPRCGQPFGDPDQEDHTCGKCLTGRRYFRKARSILTYDKQVARLISDYKYHDRTQNIRLLGWLMRGWYPFAGEEYSAIVPVPLHVSRLRFRGYNQSLLLANKLSGVVGVRVEGMLLKRVRNTPPQVGLAMREREANVKSAFAMNPSKRHAGKSVLLVDDVYTTGSTAGECAKALRKGGVAHVDVLTLARAV